MLTTLLVQIWYDGASPAAAPPPASNTFDGGLPLGAFAFFRGYGQGSTTTRDPGARKHRRRATLKRIEHEQRIVKEYLGKLEGPAAPIARQHAVAAVEAALDLQRVPSLPDVARQAVESAEAGIKAASSGIDFKSLYWARFVTLVINNLH